MVSLDAHRRLACVHSLEQSYNMICLSKRIVEHVLRQCSQISSVCILVSHTRRRKKDAANAVNSAPDPKDQVVDLQASSSHHLGSAKNIYGLCTVLAGGSFLWDGSWFGAYRPFPRTA